MHTYLFIFTHSCSEHNIYNVRCLDQHDVAKYIHDFEEEQMKGWPTMHQPIINCICVTKLD